MKVTRIVGAVLCTLCFTVNAAVVTKNEFSLTLPNGWVEVPQDVLTAVNDEVKRQGQGASMPRYDYAFQPGSAQNWLEYPYVLVQISNVGRTTEGQLKKLPAIDTNQILSGTASKLSGFMSNTKLGQMQYDQAAHVIWMTSQTDVKGVGKVQGLTGTIPTEKGVVQLHGYALESGFAEFLPTFRQIVQSTAIAPDLAYKPRWSDDVPLVGGINWAKVGEKVLAGGIAGAFIGLIAALVRRSRRTSKP
jgi:hypothetical protein